MALLETSLDGLSREDLVKIIRSAEKIIATNVQEVGGLEGMWLREGDPWELRKRAEVDGVVGPWCWSKEAAQPQNRLARLPSTPPSLPNELLREIFSHCDRRSCSSVCMSSFLFLELASPLLYETMWVKFGTRLDPFVNPTYSPSLAKVLPRLSLDKVVNLALNCYEYDDDYLPSAHSSSPYPILPFPSLQHLTLHFTYDNFSNDMPEDKAERRSVHFPKPLESVVPLLSTLSPHVLTVSIFEDPTYVDGISQAHWEEATSRWTNLATIHFMEGSSLLIGKESDKLSIVSPAMLARSPFGESLNIEWDFYYTDWNDEIILDLLVKSRSFESDAVRAAGGCAVIVEYEEHLDQYSKVLQRSGLPKDVLALIDIKLAEEDHPTRWPKPLF